MFAADNLPTELRDGQRVVFRFSRQALLRGQLLDPAADRLLGILRQQAVRAQLVVSVFDDPLLLRPAEHLGRIVGSKPLFQPQDARQDHLSDLRWVFDLGDLAQANVASTTALSFIRLAEMLE